VTEQNTTGDLPVIPPNIRKRARSELSVDELDSADNRDLKRKEARVESETLAEDDDYTGEERGARAVMSKRH
jgi:hypothetical protein